MTRASDKELARYDWFRTAALFSKHVHDANILPFLTEVMELLRELEKCGEFRYVDLSISYVTEAGHVPDKGAFQQTITNGLTCIEEGKVMILAEEWKKEGFEQGIQQEMERSLEKSRGLVRTIAKNMLAENIPLDLIAKLTGISIKELKDLCAHL